MEQVASTDESNVVVPDVGEQGSSPLSDKADGNDSNAAQIDEQAFPGATAIQRPVSIVEPSTILGGLTAFSNVVLPSTDRAIVSGGKPGRAPATASDACASDTGDSSDADIDSDSDSSGSDADMGDQVSSADSDSDSDSEIEELAHGVAALNGTSDREQGQLGGEREDTMLVGAAGSASLGRLTLNEVASSDVQLESTSATEPHQPSSGDNGPAEARELGVTASEGDASTGVGSSSPVNGHVSGDDNTLVNGVPGDGSLSLVPGDAASKSMMRLGSAVDAVQNEEQASSVESSGQVAELALDAAHPEVPPSPTSTAEQVPIDGAVEKIGKTDISKAVAEPTTMLADDSSSDSYSSDSSDSDYSFDGDAAMRRRMPIECSSVWQRGLSIRAQNTDGEATTKKTFSEIALERMRKRREEEDGANTRGRRYKAKGRGSGNMNDSNSHAIGSARWRQKTRADRAR
ncbi:hypothetical protein GGI18_005141, partial [Coemansia linderi]